MRALERSGPPFLTALAPRTVDTLASFSCTPTRPLHPPQAAPRRPVVVPERQGAGGVAAALPYKLPPTPYDGVADVPWAVDREYARPDVLGRPACAPAPDRLPHARLLPWELPAAAASDRVLGRR